MPDPSPQLEAAKRQEVPAQAPRAAPKASWKIFPLRSARVAPPPSLAQEAEALIAQGDPDSVERRAARLDLVDSKLDYLRYARQCRATHKTAEEIAKFGSGSLFGATALLLLTTSAAPLVAGTAGLTLLLFLGGTTIASMFDRKSAQWEHKAARIDAVLAEADR